MNKDQEAALDWLFTGQIGSSSKALCAAFLGKPSSNISDRPSDPDDLHRCRLFLERLSPEGQRQALAAISSRFLDWVPLVREWNAICELMDREAPNWRAGHGSAPETYHRMQLLEVDGMRLRYPKAKIVTRPDGTLSSFENRKEIIVTLQAEDFDESHL